MLTDEDTKTLTELLHRCPADELLLEMARISRNMAKDARGIQPFWFRKRAVVFEDAAMEFGQ